MFVQSVLTNTELLTNDACTSDAPEKFKVYRACLGNILKEATDLVVNFFYLHIWTFLDNENEFEEYSDELHDETNGGKSLFCNLIYVEPSNYITFTRLFRIKLHIKYKRIKSNILPYK